MKKLLIKSITPSGKKQVYDLSVEGNHNFFITEKSVLTHNCDYLSKNAQALLRNAMEEFSQTVRFILTCNYPHLVIPALHSRCQGFHIDKIDHTEFTARVATVLVTEGVEFELPDLDTYVSATYPDLRKCLNLLQMNSAGGKLQPPKSTGSSAADYRLEMVALFKAGKIREARTLLCNNARAEEMDEIYRWCYENLNIWSASDDGQDEAILIIRRGLVNHALVADVEVNLSATLTELMHIGK